MTDPILRPGEVWFASFPLEENPDEYLDRPVIILNVEPVEVLSVKVTKTKPRPDDEFDTPIVYWRFARLRVKSTARVSKTIMLPKSMFRRKIGTLHKKDFLTIQEAFMRFVSSQE